jgi:hypothetical protein
LADYEAAEQNPPTSQPHGGNARMSRNNGSRKVSFLDGFQEDIGTFEPKIKFVSVAKSPQIEETRKESSQPNDKVTEKKPGLARTFGVEIHRWALS